MAVALTQLIHESVTLHLHNLYGLFFHSGSVQLTGHTRHVFLLAFSEQVVHSDKTMAKDENQIFHRFPKL